MSGWGTAPYFPVSQASSSSSAPCTPTNSRPDGSSPSSSSRSPGTTRGRSVSFRGNMGSPDGLKDWRGQISWANLAVGLAAVGLTASAVALAFGAQGGRSSSSSAAAAASFKAMDSANPSSAVLVNSGFRGTATHSRVRLPGDAGRLGGGFEDGPSLWCYALMLPWGYEPHLLAAQLSRGVGIFSCNEWAVFSNGSTQVICPTRETPLQDVGLSDNAKVPNAGDRQSFITLPIGGDLYVEFGGKWHTAMNTDIFIRAWSAVIKLASYKKHHWTVKADPDSVFFPARLRQMVIDEPAGAVYLNNCRFGLHGPIEVITREAIDLYAEKSGDCESIRKDAMDMTAAWDDEDHAYGEDEFIHRCFDHLGVKRVDELGLLLSETACDQESVPCDEGKVSFHPFKTMQEYFDCWGKASVSSSAWARAMSESPMPVLAS
jgi:hypothetical protein